MKYKITLTNRD